MPKNESSTKNEFVESVSEECPPSPVEVGKVLQVHVTSASSPLDFWVTCPAENSNTDLPLLMDRIEDVCSSAHADKHLIEEPKVGMLCVAKYSDEIWYRAKIIAVLDNGMVQVLFIDYGNTFEVPASEIWELAAEYMEPPPQAVKGFLSTIEPCDPSLGWDEASCSRFDELVTVESKPFEFHVSKVVRSGNGQLLELHGLLLDDGVDVGGELVKEGYARAVAAEDEVLKSCVVVPDEKDNAVVNIPVVSSDDFESRQEITSETNSDKATIRHDEQSPRPHEDISEHDEYANEDDQFANDPDTVSEYPEELSAQAEEPSSYPLPNESDSHFSEDAEKQVQFENGASEFVDGGDGLGLETAAVTLGSGEFASVCDEHVEQHSPSVQQSEFTDHPDSVKHIDHTSESNADGTNQCAEESNEGVDEPTELIDASENYYDCATYLVKEDINVSSAEKWIAKDVGDADRVVKIPQNADDDDDMFKQVNETRQMLDSAGTELVESVGLDDTETSSETFRKY